MLRRLATGLAIVVLYLSQPGLISAHAELVMATPEPGANLEKIPNSIRLVFSEPVSPGAPLAIYNLQFQEVAALAANWSADSPEEIWADMPSLSPGTYTLQWQVLSLDGHPSSGSYQFSVIGPADIPLSSWTLLLFGILFAAVLVLGIMGIRRLSR